jgi:enterochelin esterase-like enzyme
MNKLKISQLKIIKSTLLNLVLILFFSSNVFSQNFNFTPNDTLTSVTLLPDNSVIFRIYVPKASEVMLGGTDIPNIMNIGRMIKQENGIWEITIGPLEPGAYRYNYNVDGLSVIDPRRAEISESNMNIWSLLYIPGAEFMETKNVPHGSLSEVTYYSNSLNQFRRMHVYTPPGYETSMDKYPVLYLLHGILDGDDSWMTVGRAGFILDNLIADKKALPMIVVMPACHTGPFRFGMPRDTSKQNVDELVEDFRNDIKPHIEKNFRILDDRKNTAIAGLSMGGAQTLNIAIPNLEEYAYIGVFSSGVFGISGGNSFRSNPGQTWEERNKKYLDDQKQKDGLELIWFATGKDDFLLETSRATVKALKNHGFNVVYKETSGGHTWSNWREYLYEFAQQLFK